MKIPRSSIEAHIEYTPEFNFVRQRNPLSSALKFILDVAYKAFVFTLILAFVFSPFSYILGYYPIKFAALFIGERVIDIGPRIKTAHADEATVTIVITVASGSALSNQWTVPVDWNSASNSIEVIGGGGTGGDGTTGAGAGGGGGGGYSKITNLTLNPSDSIDFNVGASGSQPASANRGGKGGNTWFNSSTFAQCKIDGADACVSAEGGEGGGGSTTGSMLGGAGGGTTSASWDVGYSGGNGGNGSGNDGSGGGGGAGGPHPTDGNGENGGNGSSTEGGGGGGGGGASATAGSNSDSPSANQGGDGGHGYGGTGGGDGGNGVAGGAGTAPGAGGGGGDGSNIGGGGANGAQWATNIGSGGGGGGAGDSGSQGGKGGLYGGGGGGGATCTTTGNCRGANGVIVVKYTPASNTAPSAPVLDNDPSFDNIASDSTPFLGFFNSTDSDDDDLEYEINWDTDPNFTAPVLASQSSADHASNGFSAATFSSGASVSYQIGAGESLTNGQTYYWRTRARDPDGSNTWSSYSASRSLTVDTTLSRTAWFQTTQTQFAGVTFSDAVASDSDSIALDPDAGVSGVTLVDDLDPDNCNVDVDTTCPSLILSSVTNTATDNALMVVPISIINNGNPDQRDISTVTWNSQNLTQLFKLASDDDSVVYIYYLKDEDLTAATSNVTITMDAAGAAVIVAGVLTFEGVDQTTPFGSVFCTRDDPTGDTTGCTSTGTDINSPVAVTVTDSDTDEIIVDVLAMEVAAAGTAAATNPQVERWDESVLDSVGPSHAAVSTRAGDTGSIAMEWTTTNMEHQVFAATSINAASGGGSAPTTGTAMSDEVDFDWVTGQPASWGNITWNVTEPTGSPNSSVSMQVFYTGSTACDTIVPDSAIPGNSTGLDSASSPLDISNISTSSYNRLCLKATLNKGGASLSPTLDDWQISWFTEEGASTFTQNNYMWRYNSDSIDPGGTIFGENNTGTIFPDQPLRLRINVTVGSDDLPALSQAFKLKYSTSLSGPWTDVGATTSSDVWKFYENESVVHGTEVSSTLLLSSSDIRGLYMASNSMPANPNGATMGQDIEYDFSLDPSNADYTLDYYFRLFEDDDDLFEGQSYHPRIRVTDPNSRWGGGPASSNGDSGGGTPQSGGGEEGGSEGSGGDSESGGGEGEEGGEEGGGGGVSPIMFDLGGLSFGNRRHH